MQAVGRLPAELVTTRRGSAGLILSLFWAPPGLGRHLWLRGEMPGVGALRSGESGKGGKDVSPGDWSDPRH